MSLSATRIVGFKITDLANQRDAAITFVQQRAFISLERARTIVDADVPVNVYAVGITDALLLTLPFTAIPVLLYAGLNVISTTSSKLVLPLISGETITLLATDCIAVDALYEREWRQFLADGVIRFITYDGAVGDFSADDFSPFDLYV